MLNLFKIKSKWIDIGMYDYAGYYKLVQMRFRLDNNKKEFRTVSLGFINAPEYRIDLFKNILSHNAESSLEAKNNFIKICEQIAIAVENDAKEFDGKPFDGKTVATYFGYHGAAMKALAQVIKENI